MEKIEILYDHYKDTFAQQKIVLKKRNLYTYILLGLVLLFSFQRQETYVTEKIVNRFLEEYIGNISIRMTYVNTVFSIVYLFVCMSYFQVSLNIERVYPYIHKLEDILSHEDLYIKREGFNYLKSYPWMLWWVHRIYQLGFPLGLVFVSSLQIKDFSLYGLCWYSFINILLFFISIWITLLYMSYLHLHEQYFDKEQYPDLQFWERWKYYFIGNSNNK